MLYLGGKKVKNEIQKEEGSFTIEATIISMIVFLIIINIISYVFIMYDKNKVSAVINEAALCETDNEKLSSGNIYSKIRDDLNNKLYATSVGSGGISVSVSNDKVCDITVKIATNSKIYSLARLLTKRDYTIQVKSKSNCGDIMEQVYKKINLKK